MWGETVRHDPAKDLFVIVAAPGTAGAPGPVFADAYRRGSRKRLAFAVYNVNPASAYVFGAEEEAACLAALALLLGVVIVGLVVARRRLRVGRDLATSERSAYAAVASDPPTYRRSPVAAVPPPSQPLLAEGVRRAKRALVVALVTVAALLVTFALAAGCLMILDNLAAAFS
jgi:hypothetical protein